MLSHLFRKNNPACNCSILLAYLLLPLVVIYDDLTLPLSSDHLFQVLG